MHSMCRVRKFLCFDLHEIRLMEGPFSVATANRWGFVLERRGRTMSEIIMIIESALNACWHMSLESRTTIACRADQRPSACFAIWKLMETNQNGDVFASTQWQHTKSHRHEIVKCIGWVRLVKCVSICVSACSTCRARRWSSKWFYVRSTSVRRIRTPTCLPLAHVAASYSYLISYVRARVHVCVYVFFFSPFARCSVYIQIQMKRDFRFDVP